MAALVAGCGTLPQAQSNTRPAVAYASHLSSWVQPEAKKQDLLYVADRGVVSIYSYPKDKLVGQFDTYFSYGLCSDSQGNVFVVEGDQVQEYAHGGEQPIQTLTTPDYDEDWSCSVDARSHTLAVASYAYDSGDSGNVWLYANETGTPVTYPNISDFAPNNCAYDDKGNLFVVGYKYVESSFAELEELRAGSGTFVEVKARRLGADIISSTQWYDGQLVLAGISARYESAEFQYAIRGLKAKQVSESLLAGASRPQQSWIWKHRLIVPDERNGEVLIYAYPKIAAPVAEITGLGAPQAVTISAAPAAVR